jgi:hypothetical protein
MILSGGMTIAGGTSIVSPPASVPITFKWFFGENHLNYGIPGNTLAAGAVQRANNQIGWYMPIYLEGVTPISSLAANTLANTIVAGTVIDTFTAGLNDFIDTVTVTETARVIPNWYYNQTYLVANVNTYANTSINANVYFKSNIATINWTI